VYGIEKFDPRECEQSKPRKSLDKNARDSMTIDPKACKCLEMGSGGDPRCSAGVRNNEHSDHCRRTVGKWQET
jgi:hypothetical protein